MLNIIIINYIFTIFYAPFHIYIYKEVKIYLIKLIRSRTMIPLRHQDKYHSIL